QRERFVSGAIERGLNRGDAEAIFEACAKFADYGFNKSHSAPYALLTYQTAYMKANYPVEFLAALLSSDMDRTDKVVTFVDECADLDLKMEPPDVNASIYQFAVSGARSIRYGLGAVKGVGEAAVEAIVAERAARGAYRSLKNFCQRLDLNRVNK